MNFGFVSDFGFRISDFPAGISCPKRKSQQGVILIVVLFLVILLAVVILQFQFTMKVEKRIAHNRVDDLSASYALRSKLEMARISILKGLPLAPPPSEDTGESPEFDPDIDPADLLGIKISDASARININSLVQGNGQVDPGVKRAVEKVLSELDADPALTDTIADFIDKDRDSKDEEDFYLNRPFHNISELGLVPGITPALMRPDPEADYPGLIGIFTVFSRNRINVNTAPAQVLIALVANPADEEAIPNIIEQREIEPFKSITEMYKVQGASRGMFGEFEKMLIVKPTVFVAELTAVEGKITRTATAVFEKQKGKVVLKYYEER